MSSVVVFTSLELCVLTAALGALLRKRAAMRPATVRRTAAVAAER
jgi:hypothetical protein